MYVSRCLSQTYLLILTSANILLSHDIGIQQDRQNADIGQIAQMADGPGSEGDEEQEDLTDGGQ